MKFNYAMVFLLILALVVPVMAAPGDTLFLAKINVSENFTITDSTTSARVYPIVQGNTSTDNIDQSQTTNGVPVTVGSSLGTNYQYASYFIANKSQMTNLTIYRNAIDGTPTGSFEVSIRPDNSGAPSTTVLASNTISEAVWAATPNGDLDISLPCILTYGTKYWIVMRDTATETDSSGYGVQIGTAYGGKSSTNGGSTWSDFGYTFYFKERYAKNTEATNVTVNGNTTVLDTGDVFGLLSGASISQWNKTYQYNNGFNATTGKFSDVFSATSGDYTTSPVVINGWGWTNTDESIQSASDTTARSVTYKVVTTLPVTGVNVTATGFNNNVNIGLVEISGDNTTYTTIWDLPASASVQTNTASTGYVNGNSTFYIRLSKDTTNGYIRWDDLKVTALLDTSAVDSTLLAWKTGTNTVNITSYGNAVSSSLDPSNRVNVWLIEGETPNPSASFTQNKTSGTSPLAVSFTDTSSGNPNIWVWAVNNTEIQNSSAVKDFTYTFYPVGIHQTNLTVWNTTLATPPSTASQNITVNASIVADFAAAPTSGFATLDVAFVDMSSPSDIYSWSWEFGDGLTSTERNPTHSYISAGLYTVNLTVTNPDGSKTESKVAYITVSASEDPNPESTLQFKSDINIIGNTTRYNQTIQIKNVSIASYVNGSTTFDSSHLYVTKVYANLSTYAGNTLVTSNVDNTTGLVTWQVTNVGGYTAGATPVSIVDIEMFQKSYAMGDITQSPGSGNLGNATYNTSHAIAHSELANFTYAPWITYSNFTISNYNPVIFEDIVTFASVLPSNVTADRWLWDFGDGNSTLDTTGHPVTYKYVTIAANTTLHPKLTAYLAANTSVTNTTTLTISPVYNTSFIGAAFEGSPTTGNAGLSVSFTDQSAFGASESTAPRYYNWSFGDGAYSDIKGSTSHVYTALGTYTVALSVGNSYGNSTETKVNYIIISNSQQTTWYSPKQMGITAVYRDPAGIRIPNAPMTMRAIASSIPSTATTDTQQSLQLFYGINPTAANLMMNNTLLMSGITGGDGSASFTVLASISYQVNITDPKTGVVWSSDISPSDPLGMYTVWVGNTPFAGASNTSINQLNQTKLYITQPDPGNVTFNLIYKDTSGSTSNLVFEIIAANNKTRVYGVDLGNPGTSIVLANYTLPNVIDNSYYFGYNATRSE